MLFEFLKYLQPTHYFQLKTRFDASIFPIVEHLPKTMLSQIDDDNGFKSRFAAEYNISWQAIQRGYVGEAPTYKVIEEVPVIDNYRFIRKYFNAAWVAYVLIIRLLSLKNPMKEVLGWYKTRGVKRITIEPFKQSPLDWDGFESQLIQSAPKVSVVIPTLNRYAYLKDVLNDFETQDYKNFEVIIVDQSEPFNKPFYESFELDLNIIRQEEKALWLARNNAIKAAKGKLIALSEDDVRIKPNWLSSHLKCLEYFNAEVSAGVFYPEGQDLPKERSFFAVASQFATGNAMLYKHVFNKVGLFDRQFEKQRMGDGEFGLRVYLEAITSVSNPVASCLDVKAGTGGLREMGSWDAFRPSTFFAPRPIPSVLYFFRRYFGNSRARLALLRTIPLSIFPYQFKKHKPLLILGAILTVLITPFVFYQVFRSWNLATRKLKEGPLISKLH